MATGDEPRDVDARNRDFIGYEQVDKDQDYRLAERENEEAFDEGYQIESCDLGAWLSGSESQGRTFVASLGASLEEIGFAVLVNTGVDADLYEAADLATRRVIEETSAVQREAYRARRHGAVNQGYFPLCATTEIHPDLVHGWVFCRRAFDFGQDPAYDPSEFWPLPDVEPVFRRLCLAHERLIQPIMAAILTYLGEPPRSFERRLEETNFGLRLNYYPPVDDVALASGAGRLLGHEDVNLFTLLPAPRVEGLQVLHRQTRKWIRVHAPAGAIVLNTGDYMQRITNDRLPSTTHRVAVPRDPEQRQQARVSFPMNVYLREDEVLEVLPSIADPKYPPIDALTFHTRITSKYYGDDYAVDGD